MTKSHWRIFCYLPGVKNILCTCIQPYVYHGVWHVYAALSRMFAIDGNSALPWKPSSNVIFIGKPSGIYWNETSADSSILSEHVLFFFLGLAQNRPSLEFHSLSRLSCSNLLTRKQTGSLFCICIGLSMLMGKGERYHFKTWWKSKLNS